MGKTINGHNAVRISTTPTPAHIRFIKSFVSLLFEMSIRSFKKMVFSVLHVNKNMITIAYPIINHTAICILLELVLII